MNGVAVHDTADILVSFALFAPLKAALRASACYGPKCTIARRSMQVRVTCAALFGNGVKEPWVYRLPRGVLA